MRKARTRARERPTARRANSKHAATSTVRWRSCGKRPARRHVTQISEIALAEGLERVGALDAAVEVWRAALAARPGDRKASRGLVLALVAAGRGPEAVTLARAAAEASPKDVEALFTLGLAQSEQDVSAALAAMTRVVERAPDHTLARYNLALLLKRVDRLEEAIAELMRVVALEPRPEAHYALGIAWWHRGDAARATAAFQADDRAGAATRGGPSQAWRRSRGRA